jgi:hypothetical protein
VMCTAHMVRPLYRQPICAVHVHVHVKKGGTYILSCMQSIPFQGNTDSAVHVVAFAEKHKSVWGLAKFGETRDYFKDMRVSPVQRGAPCRLFL